MDSRNKKESDILQVILKPFLTAGYAVMLIFGLAYYAVYFLVIKLFRKENYYGDLKGFKQGIKAIVFSDTIVAHRNAVKQTIKARKTRKLSAEYLERPNTRVYKGSRPTTREEQKQMEAAPEKKNFFFKRLLSYAGIFFLNKELRMQKAAEIDSKYPPRKPKVKSALSYSEAKVAIGARTLHPVAALSPEEMEKAQKRHLIQKRLMTASISLLSVCALVFVGALAYAQELPAGLNFISPKPTADLFQQTVPLADTSACEVYPELEQDLYLAYPDSPENDALLQQETVTASAALNIESNADATEVSGAITTAPKIYKIGDEDPEIAKIQSRLMELHYMKSADVTNYYGKNTAYAMEYFQRQHGLQVDGSTGAETLAVLYSAEAQEYKVDEGAEGTDVEEIQKRLYDLRYLSSKSYITGFFGSITKSAVKDFQSTNGLSPDGIVGYYTYNKLFSSSAKRNSTSSSSSSSSSSGSSGGSSVTGSGSASDIVAVAKSLYNQGYVYVWGGKSPSVGGFDCSGFVYYVLNQAGIRTGYLDTSAWATTSKYTSITNMNDVKPGDVLVFSSGHVGIYIGDGKMIHSTSKGDSDPGGIYIDNFFTDYRKSVWVWAKRVAP
ncbi:MAG: peptidoglycan-binding protein [Clostridia bacterium]|nr:peptidoglycan-binding protein [Clostridia bacterium]